MALTSQVRYRKDFPNSPKETPGKRIKKLIKNKSYSLGRKRMKTGREKKLRTRKDQRQQPKEERKKGEKDLWIDG